MKDSIVSINSTLEKVGDKFSEVGNADLSKAVETGAKAAANMGEFFILLIVLAIVLIILWNTFLFLKKQAARGVDAIKERMAKHQTKTPQ